MRVRTPNQKRSRQSHAKWRQTYREAVCKQTPPRLQVIRLESRHIAGVFEHGEEGVYVRHTALRHKIRQPEGRMSEATAMTNPTIASRPIIYYMIVTPAGRRLERHGGPYQFLLVSLSSGFREWRDWIVKMGWDVQDRVKNWYHHPPPPPPHPAFCCSRGPFASATELTGSIVKMGRGVHDRVKDLLPPPPHPRPQRPAFVLFTLSFYVSELPGSTVKMGWDVHDKLKDLLQEHSLH